MEKYTYQSLDLDRPAIRLLNLNRRSSGSKICCNLFQAELQERHKTISYEALSYIWGPARRTERITVDGYYLNVTSNLYVALQHLRHQHEDRILWIDAVCINQGSKQERGHQVEQMSKIYREAEQVIFWLGPGTFATDVLMESLQLLQRLSIEHNYNDWSLQHPLWNDMWSVVECSLERSYKEHSKLQRQGLQEILRRPWFRRVWILQEVALARVGIILCGTKSVSTRLFGLIPLLLDIKPDTHCQCVLDIMPSPWRKSSWWSKNPKLRTLLLNFGDSAATESRDLVYALRGMSSDAAAETGILPDYEKPEEDLVREVVRFTEHCELEDLKFLHLPRTIRALISCLRAFDLDRCTTLAKQSLPHHMEEYLLQRPEVKINQRIVATAAACDKTGEVIEALLRHREKEFTVSGEIWMAAVNNPNGAKEVFEVLCRHQGDQIATADGILEVAAGNMNGADGIFEVLFRYLRHQIAISDRVLEAAARNVQCGDKVLALLLSSRHRLNFGKYGTEGILIAGMANKGCGDKVMTILLSHYPTCDLTKILRQAGRAATKNMFSYRYNKPLLRGLHNLARGASTNPTTYGKVLLLSVLKIDN